jgi:hypothetical protein
VAFEVVTPHCGPVKPAPAPAPVSVRDRLAAMLEEADSDASDAEEGCDEEDYEEED